MQSEYVCEVAGVSFVDKLFCPGIQPAYWIQKRPQPGALAKSTVFLWHLVTKAQDKVTNMCAWMREN